MTGPPPLDLSSFLASVGSLAARLAAAGLLLSLLWMVVEVCLFGRRRPRWREATLHAHVPIIALARWARFRWKHPDCLYWILPVPLDRGDLLVEGLPNECLYWNLTYYSWTEINGSVSSETVELAPDGTFTIRLTKSPSGEANTIGLRAAARSGVLYYRIYEPRGLYPTRLPRVRCGGRILNPGATL
jgi:hypothetical protein